MKPRIESITSRPRARGGSCAVFLASAALTILLLNLDDCLAAGTAPEDLLLREYRPKSIYATLRTEVREARFPAIDMHSHAYLRTAEEIDEWVELMDQVGVEQTMILTGRAGAEFEKLAALYGKHPERFSLWCGFDYTGYNEPGFGPEAVKALENCREAGAVGVGELGDKGKGLFYGSVKGWGMHLDDPRMDPLLERCADLGMPVNIHVAEPKWMYERMDETNDGLMNAYKWRLDNQEGILGHQEMIDTLERALRRHPRTLFVACHLANCSYDPRILGRLLDRYPNLFADISARYAEFAPVPRMTGAFFEKYQDRLVYGTDMRPSARMYRITFRILESEDEHFYATGQFNYHWALHGLGLSEPVLRKLYRDNALGIMESGRASAAPSE